MAEATGASPGLRRFARTCHGFLDAGFAGAVGLKLVYFPGFWEKLLTSPGDLLRMAGIASFGGVFAGLAGGCLYLWRSGLPRKVVPFYLDALAFVFPRAWPH